MEIGDDKRLMAEIAASSLEQEVVAAAARRGDDDDVAAVTTTSTSPAAAAASTTRPYYECVFCKRGFTTAQALGGHMNIHRRHRGRAKPPGRRDAPTGVTSAVLSRPDVECYNQNRYLAYSTPPPPPVRPANPPTGSSFATYYTGDTAPTVAGVDADCPSLTRELSLFGVADNSCDHDLCLRLGRVDDGSPHTPEGSPEWLSGELPELDLELRLGRRPRH